MPTFSFRKVDVFLFNTAAVVTLNTMYTHVQIGLAQTNWNTYKATNMAAVTIDIMTSTYRTTKFFLWSLDF